MSLPDDPDCYWVVPDRLLAGQYPGHPDADLARTKLAALLDCGVRTFLDLTEEDEGLVPYEAALLDVAAARGVTVRYYRQPIRDVSVTDRASMLELLRQRWWQLLRPSTNWQLSWEPRRQGG
jgi:hypothetical protein